MSPEGAPTPLRVGTRGSKLATTQSQQVADLLAAHGVPAQLSIVTTTGDLISGPLAQMGGTGVFAAALRQELLTGGVDLAVHSLKDLPTQDAVDGALVDPVDVTWVAFWSLLMSCIASLPPSWNASRIDPVEALRYE